MPLVGRNVAGSLAAFQKVLLLTGLSPLGCSILSWQVNETSLTALRAHNIAPSSRWILAENGSCTTLYRLEALLFICTGPVGCSNAPDDLMTPGTFQKRPGGEWAARPSPSPNVGHGEQAALRSQGTGVEFGILRWTQVPRSVRSLLVVRPGARFVASLLLVAMPFAPSSVLYPPIMPYMPVRVAPL